MKNLFFSVAAVAIAVVSVAIVKANPKLLPPPTCPSGTVLFYLKSSVNTSLLSGLTLQAALENENNWTRVAQEDANCEGPTKVCAICAVIADPSLPANQQIPTFDDSSDQTAELLAKFEDYSSGGRTSGSDQVISLFFEKN